MPRLVVIEGPPKGSVFEITGNTTLGRSSQNPVHLEGTQISRVHARIVKKGDLYFLKDAGSRNGVIVNGKRITEHPLAPQDQIRIGAVLMVYEPDFEVRSGEATEGRVILLPDEEEEAGTTCILPAPTETDDSGVLRPEAPTDETDLHSANKRLNALYEVTAVTSSTLEEPKLLEKLLNVVLGIFDADLGAVIFCEETGKDIFPGAIRTRSGETADVSISRTVLRFVLRERKGIISADAAGDSRFGGSRSIAMEHVKSVMCAPLIAKERLLGAIYVDTRGVMKSYEEEDLRLLHNVCRQASVAIENARLYPRTREEVSQLRKKIEDEITIVGESPKIKEVLARIRKVGATSSTVLVTGETGTGKELVAHAIYYASTRRNKAFVPVDCTAISETLLESELFGHEKGAFTGADKMKLGKFEIANGGTIFFDEIGDMNGAIQQKLLRVLEERAFTRVGGVRLIHVDVRVIAATNRDLEEAVRKNQFREDLYYRLAVVPIQLPALRERPTDVKVLVDHYLAKFCSEMGKPVPEITPAATKLLLEYAWPGNVRELRNVIERAVVLAEGTAIDVDALSPRLRSAQINVQANSLIEQDLPLAEIIKQVEKSCIKRALERARGKKIEAARILGISRPTLDKKLGEYGLEV